MHSLLVNLALLLLVTQSPTTYQRGHTVRLRSQSTPSVVRIVAVPSDRILTTDTGLYVNDVLVGGVSPELLASMGDWNQSIPADHYFVIAEERPAGWTNQTIGKSLFCAHRR